MWIPTQNLLLILLVGTVLLALLLNRFDINLDTGSLMRIKKKIIFNFSGKNF